MTKFVALLRGINVGGQKAIRMQDLKRTCESMGLEKVRTYVQSGNVLFESPEREASLQDAMRDAIKASFGHDVVVILRDEGELRRIANASPFLEKDTSKLHVIFLAGTTSSVDEGAIDAAVGPGEEYRLGEREVYLFLPNGYGRTKLTNNFFERKLKTPATTRNWRTVTSILAMMEP